VKSATFSPRFDPLSTFPRRNSKILVHGKCCHVANTAEA